MGTYRADQLQESIQAIIEQHPIINVDSGVEVEVVIDENCYPAPGDLLRIAAVKYNPAIKKILLVVNEED